MGRKPLFHLKRIDDLKTDEHMGLLLPARSMHVSARFYERRYLLLRQPLMKRMRLTFPVKSSQRRRLIRRYYVQVFRGDGDVLEIGKGHIVEGQFFLRF